MPDADWRLILCPGGRNFLSTNPVDMIIHMLATSHVTMVFL
uniref:Transposase n=1 Tax=Angiostrongylus cantonensis TaxID=6313 RepID=A0A0K0D225_ANGCA